MRSALVAAVQSLSDRSLAAAAVVLLGVFTVACARWFAFPYDLSPGEGSELYYTVRLLAREPIYVMDDGFPYLYDVYPPGFYLAMAPLVALFGAHLIVGRIVSLAAALGTALLAHRWARAGGAEKSLQLAAASAFVGTAPLSQWLLVARTDALATLLGCGTVVLADALAARGRASRLWLVALLGVAACFTRQSNPLFVIAALLGVWRVFRARALLWLAVAGGASLALLLALDLWTDGAFWHSVSATVGWTSRAPFKIAYAWQYLASQAGLVLLAVAAALDPAARRAVPWGAWLGAAAGAYMMAEITRSGAGLNYFLPFHFFLVAIASRACVSLRAAGDWTRRVAVAVLALQLVANAIALWPLTHAIPDGALQRTVALERYLRTLDGPLLLDRQVALWLYTGRRDHFVEVGGLGLAAFHGDWHGQPLLDFVERRGYAAILLRSNTLMPAAVKTAMARAYREDARVALWDGVYVLLRPAPAPDAAAATAPAPPLSRY